jgi:hypothetical protein
MGSTSPSVLQIIGRISLGRYSPWSTFDMKMVQHVNAREMCAGNDK